jgi:hypothetical protein
MRPPRLVVRLLKLLGGLLLVIAVLLGTSLVVFTGPMLEQGARLVSRWKVIPLEPGRIRGNMLRGLTLEGLRWSSDAVDVRLPWAHIQLDWPRLLAGQVVVDAAEFRQPIVARLVQARPQPAGPEAPQKRSALPLRIERLVVSGGRFRWASADGPPRDVQDLDLSLRYRNERLEVARAQGRIQGTTVTLRGAWSHEPFWVDAVLKSQGPVAGRLRLQGNLDRFEARGQGAWAGAFLRLEASLRERQHWQGDVIFTGLDARRWTAAPPWLRPLNGRIRAEGSGLRWPLAAAKGSYAVQTQGGPKITGSLRLKQEVLLASAVVSENGLSGDMRGSYHLRTRHVSLGGTLEARAGELKDWTGFWGLDLQAQVRASGRFPNVRWTVDGRFSDFTYQDMSVASGALEAAGSGFKPLKLKVSASARGLEAGPRHLDTVRVDVAGGTRTHTVGIAVLSGSSTVEAAGRGSWTDGVWRATWTHAEGQVGLRWRALDPFVTEVGRGGWAASGVRLTNGQGVVRLDARRRSGRGTALDLQAVDVRSQPWVDAGLWPVALQGVFNAEVHLKGDAASLQGPADLRVSSAVMNGIALGTISVAAELRRNSVRIQDLRLEAPQGWLTAQGEIPLRRPASAWPDFDLRIRSSLDPSMVAAFWPGLALEDARFASDLRLRHHAGRLSTDGRMTLQAASARLPAGRLELRDVELQMAGEGSRIRIVQGRAASDKGSLNLSGHFQLSGPAVTLAARRFPIEWPSGLSGHADADVQVSGAWEFPQIQGHVRVLQADFRPPEEEDKDQNDTKAAPVKAPSRPSPLALDLRITFERDVWYKEDTSAIEARGELFLKKASGGPTRLLGTVETVRGQYTYLGRTFEVQEGRADFLGSVPPDPRLKARGVYVAQPAGIRVNLDLSGTRTQPQLALSSEPSWPETDIVCILATGRPCQEMRAGGEATGPEERGQQVAQQFLSSYLLQKVRQTSVFQKVDLDVFQVKTREGQADVTVGRYLTRDLFVSVEQTLGENAQRRVNAEYSLTPRWSLEGRTSSEGRYVLDLLFKVPARSIF